MSHPDPKHDRENEREEDSKFAPKKKMAKKMATKKPVRNNLFESPEQHIRKLRRNFEI